MNSTHKKKLKLLAYPKTNGRCAYCGEELDFSNFHLDHIEPKRRYKNHEPKFHGEINHGSDNIDNLIPCCSSCNSSKSDLSIELFRERIIDRVIRLNKYSHEYRIAKRFGLVSESYLEVVFYFEKIGLKLN